MSVGGVGDFNGDGFGDIAVSAPFAQINFIPAGKTFVVFGKDKPFKSSINLSSLNGKNGFAILGSTASGFNGASVGRAGDFNGDGIEDMFTGEPGADMPLQDDVGALNIVFGRKSGSASAINVSSLDAGGGLRIVGAVAFDFVSGRAAAAGDVNGDGFSDVIAGTYNAGFGGANSGSAYVVFGKPAATSPLLLQTLDGTNGFRMDGEAAGDRLGWAVGGGGDFNGDGFKDVVVGANEASPNGSKSGSGYVVFGRAPDAAVTRIGSAAAQYISGGGFVDTLQGGGRGDTLEGRAGGDVLAGGGGNNTASYFHSPGAVTVVMSNMALNTGDAVGDSFTNIQNLSGSNLFADTLSGNNGANRLSGNGGADLLSGKGGNDILTGGADADTLRGGRGKDRFVYRSASDSFPLPDSVKDFNPGGAQTRVDSIDLRAIDAKAGKPGNQAFTFIGTRKFSRTKGELRLKKVVGAILVLGDVTGDGVADLEIRLEGLKATRAITRRDFRL
jgi:Ca2+-binding RTX toxin-like protein